MVKSGTPEKLVERRQPAKNLTQKLRQEGQSLLQTRNLLQTTPVSPLQLHSLSKTLDPLLLSPGSVVAVMTDSQGQAAVEYARKRPQWMITGWVSDTKSFLSLQNRSVAENLVFDKQPQAKSATWDFSPQAILAPAWAHRVFSDNHYNVNALVQEVQNLLDILPEHGQLLIQDFYLPEKAEDFVTIDLEHDEAVQALLDFSQCARPHAPKALQGFFVEALPAARAGVQRFRLPLKWAAEFYHRWRCNISIDAPYELTSLSLEQWAALIEQCGARVLYRAPHALPRKEAATVGRHLRFTDEQGHPLPLPAASFTLLVEKLPASAPLTFYERRVSTEQAADIRITGIKNKQTDEKSDVVEIRNQEDDLLPWYLDTNGKLRVLIRTNVPRPIINSVPRGTPNLDGRHWAGYLIEPLVIPHLAVGAKGEYDTTLAAHYIRDVLPLPPQVVGKVQVGVEYYPAPEYLAQRVRGLFVSVQPVRSDTSLPPMETGNGRILDVLADDVLRAIDAGYIPDGKLEILIGQLMMQVGLQPEKTDDILVPPAEKADTKKMRRPYEARWIRSLKDGDHMVEFVEDTPTDSLRVVRSVFVEDQMTSFGRQVGQFDEHDFIVPNNHLSTNTAVCVPFAKDPLGGFMIGTEPRQMPVPNRMGTEEPLLHMPSFTLPVTVKTVDQARYFLAKQMECNPDDLFPLGNSYFVQPQISAERVYPFLMNIPAWASTWLRWHKPKGRLYSMTIPHVEKSSAYLEQKALRDLGEWYTGFSPELMQKPDSKANAKSGAKSETQQPLLPHVLSAHPLVKPQIG